MWHGPALDDAVADITPAEAASRPVAAAQVRRDVHRRRAVGEDHDGLRHLAVVFADNREAELYEGNESSVKPKNSLTVPERYGDVSQTRMPAGRREVEGEDVVVAVRLLRRASRSRRSRRSPRASR